MNLEQNKDLVRRYQDAHNANNLAALDTLVAPDLLSHAPLPGMAPGLESGKQAHRMAMAAMPDLHLAVEELIAEGDKVVMRFTTHGTHTAASFMGLPPSGRQVNVDGISIFRIAGGRIVEHWATTDTLSLLQQLGALPAPAQAGI